MTNKQMVATVTDTDFGQNVVLTAILRQALVIYAENPATTGHAARATLATAVARNPENYTRIFALLIGVDDAFLALTVVQGNNLAAATAEARIASVWNIVAGV